MPRNGVLDPDDVIVSFHPTGTYGVTEERTVPFGCGGTTDEVPLCDGNTVRVQVTEGLVGAVFTLRNEALTELQANRARTVDGFDVFEFSGIGLLGEDVKNTLLFARIVEGGRLTFFDRACVLDFDFEFVPNQVREVECTFEDF
ncbi:MAG: hypothetical protein AAGD10_15230 [Myxococcota bacterium]